jgi:hypothetical protein
LVTAVISDEKLDESEMSIMWKHCKDASKRHFDETDGGGEELTCEFLAEGGKYTGFHLLDGLNYLLTDTKNGFKYTANLIGRENYSAEKCSDTLAVILWKLVFEIDSNRDRPFQESFSHKNCIQFLKYVDTFKTLVEAAYVKFWGGLPRGKAKPSQVNLAYVSIKYLFMWVVNKLKKKVQPSDCHFNRLFLIFTMYGNTVYRDEFDRRIVLTGGGGPILHSIQEMLKKPDTIFELADQDHRSLLDDSVLLELVKNKLSLWTSKGNGPIYFSMAFCAFGEKYITNTQHKVRYDREHIVPKSTICESTETSKLLDGLGNIVPIPPPKQIGAGVTG